ncbi:MAG: hypothetical protein ACYSWW_26210, partial [Planctomycetota bacterium]
GVESENLSDSYVVKGVSDMLRFSEGRMAIGLYLAGGANALSSYMMGAPEVSNALESAFMQDGELQFGFNFVTGGQVKRPFEADRRLEQYERRFRELVVTAAETSLNEVAMLGAAKGLGALSHALRASGAGSAAGSFLTGVNRVDDARGLFVVNNGGKLAQSNAQLIDDIATRAHRWSLRSKQQRNFVGLSKRTIGTKKHKYSKDLLLRHQKIFGQRGLLPESSWLNGSRVPYGTRGSVRLDVFDPVTGMIWDYKFGIMPMGATQKAKIMKHGPSNMSAIWEVMKP